MYVLLFNANAANVIFQSANDGRSNIFLVIQ